MYPDVSEHLKTQATTARVPPISSPAGLHRQVHGHHLALMGGRYQGAPWEQDMSA